MHGIAIVKLKFGQYNPQLVGKINCSVLLVIACKYTHYSRFSFWKKCMPLPFLFVWQFCLAKYYYSDKITLLSIHFQYRCPITACKLLIHRLHLYKSTHDHTALKSKTLINNFAYLTVSAIGDTKVRVKHDHIQQSY